LEWLEESRDLGRWNSAPGVFDRQLPLISCVLRGDPYPAVRSVVADGVCDQVGDQVSDQVSIAEYKGAFEGEVRFEGLHVLALNDLGDDRAEIDFFPALQSGPALGEGEEDLEKVFLLLAGTEHVLADLAPGLNVSV
jgi:hypothetical protein